MSEKFSIITIDTDKLNEKICNYICKTGETNPYIFMSKETTRALESLAHFHPLGKLYRRDCFVARFDGHKIFTDDDLSFGEIEIR